MKGTVQILGKSGATRPLPCEDQVYELERNQILRIRDGKGATLRVVAGALWVTQDRDARDLVLQPGEDFVLDRNGLAVFVPLTEGSTRLVLGNAGRQARRALSWLPLGRNRGAQAAMSGG